MTKNNMHVKYIKDVYGKSVKTISGSIIDIEQYINKLDLLIKKISSKDRLVSCDNINFLKEYFYDKYIIKEEFVKQYLKKKNDDYIEKSDIKTIIDDQKTSLDKWIYFLFGNRNYPSWYKYYVFRSVVGLGTYNKQNKSYRKRTKNTIVPFVHFNNDALDFIYKNLISYLDGSLENSELSNMFAKGNFGKIYAFVLNSMNYSNDNIGIWKKYEVNSDAEILYNDLYGHNTNWCTANGLEIAKKQLQNSEFYIYYTKDNKENYSIPRIAIRKVDGLIYEIRGILDEQNLESNMEKALNKKISSEDFFDRDLYIKKLKNMKLLNHIYTKTQNGIELTKDELRFLYEVDDVIIGFGYEKDSRIKGIINKRNIREDLMYVLSCNYNEISLSKEEALSGNIKYHYGDLNLKDLDLLSKKIILPKNVNGNIFINGSETLEIEFPKIVNGNLYVGSIQRLSNVVLPGVVYGNFDLERLKEINNSALPRIVYGNVNINGLENVEELVLPEQIYGNLGLRSLKDASNVLFPTLVTGDCYFDNIENIDNAILPNYIMGSLYLNSLKYINYLTLPKVIGDSLVMWDVESINQLLMPKSIGGAFAVPKLNDISGIILNSNYTKDNLIRNLEEAMDPYFEELCSNSLKLINQVKSKNELVKVKKI